MSDAVLEVQRRGTQPTQGTKEARAATCSGARRYMARTLCGSAADGRGDSTRGRSPAAPDLQGGDELSVDEDHAKCAGGRVGCRFPYNPQRAACDTRGPGRSRAVAPRRGSCGVPAPRGGRGVRCTCKGGERRPTPGTKVWRGEGGAGGWCMAVHGVNAVRRRAPKGAVLHRGVASCGS